MPPISTALALALALEQHRGGRLDVAEEIYRRILAVEPEHVFALHMLGVLLHQTGRSALAVEHIGRAIAGSGGDAPMHSNLGEAYRGLGRTAEAIAEFRKGLALDPAAAEIHYNLANVLKGCGQVDEAIAGYRRAVQLKPGHFQAWNNLGNALRQKKDLPAAIAALRQTLALRPDFVDAIGNLGLALQEQGRVAEAIACCRQAVARAPHSAEAWINLAAAHRAANRPDEALALLERAAALQPDSAQLHYHRGFPLQDQCRYAESAAAFRRATELAPRWAPAWYSRGYVLSLMGEVEESLACMQRALQCEPDDAGRRSGYLITLQHRPDITLADLAAAHAEYEARHAAPLVGTWRAHPNSRDSQRRLRIGILSPLLWNNPAAQLLIRPLEGLTGRDCDVLCYACHMVRDHVTERLAAATAAWRNVTDMPDAELAEQIRHDGIDVLLDVAGHLANNRLLAVARRPAPVQVTWLAYEGTTGLAAIDYILGDRHVIPAGAERFYRERVLRMPDGYVCYDPPDEAPAVNSLPARSAGHLTLASFSKPMKITAAVVRVWAAMMHRVPRARLLLKYAGFENSDVQRRYTDMFRHEGIAAERLEFAGRTPLANALAEYQRVDLALDPFPFSGSLTTCDALWMGVPVVTWPGETLAGRHSLSYLATLGLTELVAGSAEQYVEIAVGLAQDLPRLAALRESLRPRMAASPVCDGPRFAGHLLDVLRAAWRAWCET